MKNVVNMHFILLVDNFTDLLIKDYLYKFHRPYVEQVSFFVACIEPIVFAVNLKCQTGPPCDSF